jgi:cell division protein FtsB
MRRRGRLLRQYRFREDEDCATRKIECLEGEVEALKRKVQALMKKWDFVEPFLEEQCKAEGVSTPQKNPHRQKRA